MIPLSGFKIDGFQAQNYIYEGNGLDSTCRASGGWKFKWPCRANGRRNLVSGDHFREWKMVVLLEYSDLDASYAREKDLENGNTVSQYMGMYSLEKLCLRSGT